MEKLISVGEVSSSHGIKGELFVYLFGGEATWLDGLETFVLDIETNGKNFLKTFTVQAIRKHKKGFIVKTKEIVDRNESDSYIGAQFQIPMTMTVSQPGETIFLGEIEGFSVEDEVLGDVGTIVSFSSNGAQDLLVVSNPKGKFQIPLVKDFLVEIVWAEKKLKMRLPPGLLETE